MRRLEGPSFDPYRIPLDAMTRDMQSKIAAGHPHAPKYAEFLRRNPPDKVRDDECNGIFDLVSPLGARLHVMASSGGGWDHVSVSTATRCPTWEEMDWVKRYFFKESEVAMQLHVTPKDHINFHSFTLHLWRPLKGRIPLPPGSYV